MRDNAPLKTVTVEPEGSSTKSFPLATGEIRSYHAHVYFNSPAEREQACGMQSDWAESLSNDVTGAGLSAVEINTLPRSVSE